MPGLTLPCTDGIKLCGKCWTDLPGEDTVGVDAGQAKHEDGGEDQDQVKTSKTNQQAIDGALHLRPDIGDLLSYVSKVHFD